ncbi:unnamed protein product [Meloidogyne enterolobii]|uniref:Uncharacterized protein n=1 Tax=Meloidogyne enterolobii TaxID=390850 RepID=A0ACB1B3X1_MELEN
MNFKRTKKATSSPDTKEENEEEFETNNDLYSKDFLMNKRRRNMIYVLLPQIRLTFMLDFLVTQLVRECM